MTTEWSLRISLLLELITIQWTPAQPSITQRSRVLGQLCDQNLAKVHLGTVGFWGPIHSVSDILCFSSRRASFVTLSCNQGASVGTPADVYGPERLFSVCLKNVRSFKKVESTRDDMKDMHVL